MAGPSRSSVHLPSSKRPSQHSDAPLPDRLCLHWTNSFGRCTPCKDTSFGCEGAVLKRLGAGNAPVASLTLRASINIVPVVMANKAWVHGMNKQEQKEYESSLIQAGSSSPASKRGAAGKLPASSQAAPADRDDVPNVAEAGAARQLCSLVHLQRVLCVSAAYSAKIPPVNQGLSETASFCVCVILVQCTCLLLQGTRRSKREAERCASLQGGESAFSDCKDQIRRQLHSHSQATHRWGARSAQI